MTPTIMNGNDGRPWGTIMIRPRTFKDIKLGEERYATSYNTVWSKRTVLREQCVHTAICKWVFGDKKALTLEEPTGQPHHAVLYIGSGSGVPNHWWFNQPIILLHDHSADQCLGSILQPFGWEAEMLTNAPIRCCCECKISHQSLSHCQGTEVNHQWRRWACQVVSSIVLNIAVEVLLIAVWE